MLKLSPFRDMVKRLLGRDGEDADSNAPTDRQQINSSSLEVSSGRYASIGDRLTDCWPSSSPWRPANFI